MIKCKLCNKTFNTKSGLGRHTALTHGISKKDYYDRFNKKLNEGKCKICGKETKFRDSNTGYLTYCSSKCANLDPDIREKSKETYKRKTGYEHNMHNPDSVKKFLNTIKERYGDHKEKIVEKIQENNLKKYGVKNYFNTKDYKIKSDKTMIEKYGVDNIFKDKNFQIKNKSNFVEKRTREFIKGYLDSRYKLLEINGDRVKLKCPNGHIFECLRLLIRRRKEINHELCTICKPLYTFGINYSSYEKDLLYEIKSFYNGTIIQHENGLIKPLSLDLYIPELKLAIEFNGLYWHSELYKNKNYHLNKTEKCIERGIHLIHIYEDDWLYKKDIVISRLKNLFKKSNIIYARRCSIKEVNFYDEKRFLEKNHIQGWCISKYRYGLYYNNELVSLMTFGNTRINLGKSNEEFELLRFCNKINYSIVGGASRLFKHFCNVIKPKSIISYADRSWSNGELYEKLGFVYVKKTIPNYQYVVDKIRLNRFNFRKNKLVEDGNDPTKTEHEIMNENKHYRIYDAGSLKYKYSIE